MKKVIEKKRGSKVRNSVELRKCVPRSKEKELNLSNSRGCKEQRRYSCEYFQFQDRTSGPSRFTPCTTVPGTV